METKNLLNKKITQWLLLVAMLFGFSGALSADKYVYFDSNKGDWEKEGSASACHYWGGTGSDWPGKLMTKVSGESHIWYYKVPSGNDKCVFVRVSSDGKSDWGAKTTDQSTPSTSTSENLCTMSSFNWGDTKCTASFSGYYALTPTAVTLTVTDGKISGSGTSSDPYMVEAGDKFTLSASNLTFSPADPDMKGYYYFGTSSTGTPNSDTSSAEMTASSTVGNKTQYYVIVKGKYNTTTSSSTKSASVYVQTKSSCVPPTAYNVSGPSSVCAGSNAEITLSGSQTGYTYELYKDGVATSTTQAGTGSSLTFSAKVSGSNAAAFTIKGYVTGTPTCTADMDGTATITIKNAVVTTQPELDNIHPYEVVTLTATNKEDVTWTITKTPDNVIIDKNAYFTEGNTGKTVKFKGALGKEYQITATADGCDTEINFDIILDSEVCN